MVSSTQVSLIVEETMKGRVRPTSIEGLDAFTVAQIERRAAEAGFESPDEYLQDQAARLSEVDATDRFARLTVRAVQASSRGDYRESERLILERDRDKEGAAEREAQAARIAGAVEFARRGH